MANCTIFQIAKSLWKTPLRLAALGMTKPNTVSDWASTHNTHVSIVSRHQSGRNKPANFEWLFEVADAGHGLAK